MANYRRSSAESGQNEAYAIIEENVKDQGIVRRYSKRRFLGKGGFAKCYELMNLESKKCIAAKIIPKSSLNKSRAKQKLLSEINIHKSLRHQNIVGFDHFFEDHENVYILLEICTNQTMNELIKRRKQLKEIEVQCYLMQILSAMKYLHSHRVIHRDLKLGNLFLSDKMEIKLGDFGLATKLDYDGERKKTICGTPNYIAPEILEGKETGHSYEVDIWSFGVIAYTLLIGKPPFETNDVKATYKKIKMNDFSFPESIIISQSARNLIKSLIVTDPSKRLTINEILNHEFFTSTNIPKLLPVSTLACPPSTSYISQFKIQVPSFIQNPKLTENSLGRSQSPKRFDYTAPQVGFSTLAQIASCTQYNSTNFKSNQQIGLKERKDFGNTYHTGVTTTGLANADYSNTKIFQTGTNINGKNVESALPSHQNNSNQQILGIAVNTSLTKNSSSAQLNNFNNIGENNSPTRCVSNGYSIINKQIQNPTLLNQQQASQNQGKTVIEKYSSSSNLNSQNNSNANGNPYSRARSEKLHTQPSSSNPPSYGNGLSLAQTTTITQNLSGTHFPQSIQQQDHSNIEGPDLWVKKWVDYSTKYGLGYLLSNGQTGVYFNDSTKILLNPLTENFDYYERGSDKQNVSTLYSLQSYPAELQKKVTLLQHFRIHLEGEDKEKNKEFLRQQAEANKLDKKIFVKKWMRTKHTILFLFNNKVAQVIFQDQTEIVLSNELRVVTYVNKKHQRLSYPLATAMESTNQEMQKRFKHTKDILSHMYTNGSSTTTKPQIKNDTGPENNNTNPISTLEDPLSNQENVLIETKNTPSLSKQGFAPQRENLHFSKQGFPPNYVGSSQQLHNAPSYNNYISNENLNTQPGGKNSLLSTQQHQLQSSGSCLKTLNNYGNNNQVATTSSYASCNKKDINQGTNYQTISNNMSSENALISQNLLKANTSLGRLSCNNPVASNSLQNLNNFNNCIISSRKADF